MPCVALGFNVLAQESLRFNAALDLSMRKCAMPTSKALRFAACDTPLGVTTSNESVGWKSLKELYRLLDLFDQSKEFKRNAMQRRAIDFYIQATLRAIFGSDFGHNIAKLRQMFRLTELRQEVLVSAPRRNGKTYATCMFSSAVMCAVPNITIACFSTGRRASRAFLLTTYKMIVFLGFRDWIKEFNQEVMVLKNPKDDRDERKISSFPSRPDIGRVFQSDSNSSRIERRQEHAASHCRVLSLFPLH